MINIDLKAIFINYSALLCFVPRILYYVYITALVAVLIARTIQHQVLNKYACHGSAAHQMQWKGWKPSFWLLLFWSRSALCNVHKKGHDQLHLERPVLQRFAFQGLSVLKDPCFLTFRDLCRNTFKCCLYEA